MANNNRQTITGLSIYKNDHNQTIYYDIFTKKGYIILSKDEKGYAIYSSRLVLGFSFFILSYWFVNLKLVISIAIAVLVYAILAGLFRFKYLPSLTVDENFKKRKREGLIDGIAKNTNKTKLIIVILLGLFIAALGIINILINKYEGYQLIGQYVFILIGVVLSFIYFLAYLKFR